MFGPFVVEPALSVPVSVRILSRYFITCFSDVGLQLKVGYELMRHFFSLVRFLTELKNKKTTTGLFVAHTITYPALESKLMRHVPEDCTDDDEESDLVAYVHEEHYLRAPAVVRRVRRVQHVVELDRHDETEARKQRDLQVFH